MAWLALTRLKNNDPNDLFSAFVNTDLISEVSSFDGEKTNVYLCEGSANGRTSILVKETPSEIIEMIRKAV